MADPQLALVCQCQEGRSWRVAHHGPTAVPPGGAGATPLPFENPQMGDSLVLLDDGVLKITVIRVHYILKLPPKEEADAWWAFENYIENCPGAMSVTGCIDIDHSLDLVVE